MSEQEFEELMQKLLYPDVIINFDIDDDSMFYPEEDDNKEIDNNG